MSFRFQITNRSNHVQTKVWVLDTTHVVSCNNVQTLREYVFNALEAPINNFVQECDYVMTSVKWTLDLHGQIPET